MERFVSNLPHRTTARLWVFGALERTASALASKRPGQYASAPLLAPLILSATGASTLLLAYLSYKSKTRFGKLDRLISRHAKLTDKSRQQLAELRREQSAEVKGIRADQKQLLQQLRALQQQQKALQQTCSELSGSQGQVRERIKELNNSIADCQLNLSYVSSLSNIPLRFPIFYGRWTVDGVTAKSIVDAVRELRPAVVLELGSGSSTALIAAILEQMGLTNTRHIAVDHLAPYLDATRQNVELQDLNRKVEYWHCPLEEPGGNGVAHWYSDLPAKLGDTKIDLLVVDGPPGATQPEARRPALEVLRPFLSPGAIVILDDTTRPEEGKILEKWKEQYPEIEIKLEEHGKGCAKIYVGKAREKVD